jgi:FixJ family two-component response regulator
VSAAKVIAIVDDDDSVRAALGGLLRSFDFAVRTCASGQELLDAVWLREISCVVTDVSMPDLDGFELCEAIRARKLAMPVIFMTAFIERRDVQRRDAAEAACILQKPFTASELVHCIHRAIRRE